MKGTLVLSLVQQQTPGSLQFSQTHFFFSGFQSFSLGVQSAFFTSISLLGFHLCVLAISKGLHLSLSESSEEVVGGTGHSPSVGFSLPSEHFSTGVGRGLQFPFSNT
jgi:hypothetical protein